MFDTPDIRRTLEALAPYQPRLLRATVLRSGNSVLHAWLVALGRWARAGS